MQVQQNRSHFEETNYPKSSTGSLRINLWKQEEIAKLKLNYLCENPPPLKYLKHLKHMWKSNILLVFPFNKNWNDKAIYLKEVKNHYFDINCRYQFLKGFYSYWKWWGCKQYIYVDLGRLWIHSEESRILRRIYVDFVYIPGYTLCKCFFGSCKFLLLSWFYSVLWSF